MNTTNGAPAGFVLSTLGTDNLKTLVGWGIKMGMQTDEVMADGKFQPLEAIQFIDELTLLPQVVKSAKPAYEELKDLDQTEKAELNQWVIETFNIHNDHVEQVVENALDLVWAFGALISSLKASKEAKAAA